MNFAMLKLNKMPRLVAAFSVALVGCSAAIVSLEMLLSLSFDELDGGASDAGTSRPGGGSIAGASAGASVAAGGGTTSVACAGVAEVVLDLGGSRSGL